MNMFLRQFYATGQVRKITMIYCLHFFILASCGNVSQPTDGDEVNAEQSPGKSSTEEFPDPCEIMSAEFLGQFFDLPETELEHSPSKYSPHPLCTITWPMSNQEEIETEQRRRMSEYMQAKRRGEDVKIPIIRTDNELHLTITKPRFETRKQAASAFESAMRILKDGKTVEVQGQDYTSSAREIERMQGVGDDAYWVSSLNQISVLSGHFMFHLGVSTDAEELSDKEKAIAIARELTNRLK